MSRKRLILPEQDLVVSNGVGVSAVRVQVPSPDDKVFLGMPTRTGTISAGSAQAAMVQSVRDRVVLFRVSVHTNLELNYNMLMCDALNLRDNDGVKWMAMLHDDIHPESYWLDVLIGEAETHDADVMSAHVPLKDPRQLSSTALSDPDDPWCPFTRLTLKQIHHDLFPETTDTQGAVTALHQMSEPYRMDCPPDSRLLINTGCMVIRMDRPWMDGSICFHKSDAIVKTRGIWEPMSWTEDWMLARDLHDVGAKVMATRKVKLTHWDGHRFFASEPDDNGQCVDESTRTIRAQQARVRELKLLESTA